MEMMRCPHCGADNSTKREYCYQCQGDLRGAPKPGQAPGYVPTCATCIHAVVFPPPGHRLGPDQVWCSKKEEAAPSAQVAGDCFGEAFGWGREEILD